VSCEPERITAYVDDALDRAARAEVESHLASCDTCREQVSAEREVRAQLRALPRVDPRDGFEDEIRQRMRRAKPRPFRVLLPMAAALALVALWGRGAAPFVAWELARDHAHCFSRPQLPAQVWSGDSTVVASWLEARGRSAPVLPDKVADLELVGGRLCPLADRSVAHLYYVGAESHVSLFLVPGSVRFDDAYSTASRGAVVRLLRVGTAVVGIVGDREEDVARMERAFGTTVARAEPSTRAR
jgi:anti-sigma factor RsiW